jgi:hypothetical protein
MPKIVNLQDYKSKIIEEKSFGLWQKRFDDSFSHHSKLSELSNATIYTLACPGEESTEAFYEIIMGSLDLGAPLNFPYLENEQKMMVVDIHLFLADQTRFEMMRRLGWLSDLPHESNYIVEIVLDFKRIKITRETPQLNPSFPNNESYQHFNSKDREAVIRSLLPMALETFKSRKLLL